MTDEERAVIEAAIAYEAAWSTYSNNAGPSPSWRDDGEAEIARRVAKAGAHQRLLIAVRKMKARTP